MPHPPGDQGRAIAGRFRAVTTVGLGERNVFGPQWNLGSAVVRLPDALPLDLGHLDAVGGSRTQIGLGRGCILMRGPDGVSLTTGGDHNEGSQEQKCEARLSCGNTDASPLSFKAPPPDLRLGRTITARPLWRSPLASVAIDPPQRAPESVLPVQPIGSPVGECSRASPQASRRASVSGHEPRRRAAPHGQPSVRVPAARRVALRRHRVRARCRFRSRRRTRLHKRG